MNFNEIQRLIGRWAGTIRFFPADTEARIGIAEQIADFAANEDQVRWLVNRLPKLYQEWPGMLEVRAVFCSKFPAKDGINPDSTVYPEGIPSEKSEPMQQIASTPLRQLEAGEPVSQDPELAALVAKVAKSKDMNAVRVRPIKPIPVGREENEYDVLQRSMIEARMQRDKALKARAPSEEEIAFIKQQQLENAAKAETRKYVVDPLFTEKKEEQE